MVTRLRNPRFGGQMQTRVDVLDHPRDHPLDKVLCAEIGKILTTAYPRWSWWVEIPPDQNIVIVRNLDCLQAGTGKPYCMAIHKDKLSGGNMRLMVLRAGGELLERYEAYRGHCGKFTPQDLVGKRLILPQT